METLSRDTARKIIDGGIKAPSGENAQPWRFIVRGNDVYICNVIERDIGLYNFGQHGSYTAHGALIENMAIAASHEGWAADVEYFPSGGEVNVVAKLTFKQGGISEDPLYPFIAERHTNRGDYIRQMCPPEIKNELSRAVGDTEVATCVMRDDAGDIAALADASTAVERLMFENRAFHQFYYEHFFFKRSQEDQMNGFYIDVLGLKAYERSVVRLNALWPVARTIGLLKLSYPMYRKRVGHYKHSAGFGAIVTQGSEPKNYIEAGRAFERVWLTATSLGVSIQPCVGLLYLWEGIIKKNAEFFTARQADIVKEARNRILERFGDRGEGIPMFFRFGYAPRPQARSFRYEPVIDFLS